MRVVLQLFSLLQHEVSREHEVSVLSKLAAHCWPDRFALSEGLLICAVKRYVSERLWIH